MNAQSKPGHFHGTRQNKGGDTVYNPQLETFLRVADAGSFNKAAEDLFITSPAVIKQINLLESDLGLQLFIRTHRGLTLTEAGKSLYQDSKYMIQYSKDSVARAKAAMLDGNHILRIGTSPMTPGQFLMELWPKIHVLCPQMQFKLVPFENTPETAREILKNMGQNIDLVAGMFDDVSLALWQCHALQISTEPLCCAVSLHHPLAAKERLSMADLHGEKLMLIRRGWNTYIDRLRDDIFQHHPQINLVDFDFYDVEVFNRCENSGSILMTIDAWRDVHPLLKVMPLDWEHGVPFGLLHAPTPSPAVQQLLDAVQTVIGQKAD